MHSKKTLGVPVKHRSVMSAFDPFGDTNYAAVEPLILEAFQLAALTMDKVYEVVIPADELGTDLAQLNARAPTIAKLIEGQIARLQEPSSGG